MRRFDLESQESGATLVIVAILVVVLLGFGAFAVDLGYAYAVKRQLSSTSDSAALAGAQEAGLKFSAPGVGGCGPTLTGLVTDAVNANHTANDPTGTSGAPGVTIECRDKNGNIVTGTAATSVTVTVNEEASLDTWFGRILGVDTLEPDATATAWVFGSRFLTGLRPFLVCLDDAVDARAQFKLGNQDLYQSFYAKFDQKVEVTGTALFTDAEWKKNTGVITSVETGETLAVGDYVKLEFVAAGGVTPGYYYVKTATVNNKDELDFTLSQTRSGPTVVPSSNVLVDVYETTPLAGGNSLALAATDVVSIAGHGLANGTEVRVSVAQGSTGLSDGTYSVISATNDTFQLSTDGGPLDITSDSTVNVYVVAIPVGGGSCNPASSPGNWGYSAFDLTNGDNQQLACLIEFGYGNGPKCEEQFPDPPGVDVGAELSGVPAEGDQGNNLGNADGDLIRDLIIAGNPILLPVGTNWNAQGGNNAEYDGRGALSVVLCGYALPGNKPDTPTKEFFAACGDRQAYLDAVAAGQVTKETSLAIQWRYEEWVFGFQGQPSGSTAQCPLGSCVASLQLLK